MGTNSYPVRHGPRAARLPAIPSAFWSPPILHGSTIAIRHCLASLRPTKSRMGCYFAIMGFQREMICIEKMALRIGHVHVGALLSGRLYRSIREKFGYRVLMRIR
jgi:hypothetical protein